MNKSDLLHAIELALADKWDDAHCIVQGYDDVYAAWIHAVLHKIEGDENNSHYWYRQAGRAFENSMSVEEELEFIRGKLEGK